MTVNGDGGRPWVGGMYDYYLGGSANSAADRAAADQVLAAIPEIRLTAWANRGFLQRAVKRMVEEWGIRQFIDLGAGLPTQRHVHEVAAESGAACRVVYVDNDPRIAERGSQLLAETPGTAVIEADIRQYQRVLTNPRLTELIDFTEPVGLLAIAVIQWIPNEDDPWGLIRRYVDALCSGSYLAMTIPTGDFQSDKFKSALRQVYGSKTTRGVSRSLDEATRFFDGLEIVRPFSGAQRCVTYVGMWGAEDPEEADDDAARLVRAAVGRKP